MRSDSRVSEGERVDLAVLLSDFKLNETAAEIFQWLANPGTYDIGFNLALVRYRAGELDSALKIVDELRVHCPAPLTY